MEVSIDKEPNNEIEEPSADVVHLVIVRLNFSEDRVKGVFSNEKSAHAFKEKKQRLKAMKWEDFEFFSQLWPVRES